MTKACPQCRETKALAEFYKDSRKPSGVGSWCKDCTKERSKRRYWANPGAWAERHRARYVPKPKPQARPCPRCETIHERRSDYCSRRCASAYYQRNRDWRDKNNKRRTKTRFSDLREADVKALLASRTMCPLCNCRMTGAAGPRQKNLDHIVPIAIGGTHTSGNVRVICATCNGARPYDGSDLGLHQPTLWALDANAAEAIAVLRAASRRQPNPNTKTARRRRANALSRHLRETKARAAWAARRAGVEWQTIATTLGYGSPGSAHNAIRYRLGINPSRAKASL